MGSPVQDRSRQLAGERRKRQEGSQEHDACDAAQGAAGSSGRAPSKRRRKEGSAGGSVQDGALGADEAEDEVVWLGEFEPGIS